MSHDVYERGSQSLTVSVKSRHSSLQCSMHNLELKPAAIGNSRFDVQEVS